MNKPRPCLGNVFRTGARAELLFPVLATLGLHVAAAPPSIEYQPHNQTVLLYHRAAFGVIADGTAPLAYQWYKDGVAIVGATNDQVVLAHAEFSEEGSYWVVVENAEGRVASTKEDLTVRLPQAGDVDGSFVNGGGLDAPVRSIAIQPDGKILIGGEFQLVAGGFRRGGIARLNADGSTDHTFLNGLAGANGKVIALAVQGDNKVLIAGAFTSVNGMPCTNIARLKRDGSVDRDFQCAVEGTGIYCLALQSDGKVLIGGAFVVNGMGQTNVLARLNGDGSLDGSFNLNLDSYATVTCIAVQGDGKILFGGASLGRLNPDGTLDPDFQDIVLVYEKGVPRVSSMAIQSDGKIVIGGAFTSVNGNARHNLARVNANGTLDEQFNPPLPTSDYTVAINAVVVEEDGKVLVGANYTGLGPPGSANHDYYNAMRFHADRSWDRSLWVDGAVYAVAAASGGEVFIGGAFLNVSSVPRNRVARVNFDEYGEPAFRVESAGANQSVRSMTLQRDGQVLVGGGFTAFNGEKRNGAARLNPDGSLDAFNPDIWGPDYRVYCVAEDSYERVLVGGENLWVAQDRHARFYLPKSLVRFSWQAEVLAGNGPVLAMVPMPDGRVLFGGGAGVGLWPALPSNSWVRAIALQRDGKVLVGGYLGDLGSSLARLNADWTLDEEFQPGVSDGVTCIVVQPDEKIVVGGNFTSVDGIMRSRIARLNPDGTLDTRFQPTIPPTWYYIASLALQPDGKVLVAGGNWPSASPQTLLVRLNPDGSEDLSFRLPPTKSGDAALCMALQSDGKILMGGLFRK